MTSWRRLEEPWLARLQTTLATWSRRWYFAVTNMIHMSMTQYEEHMTQYEEHMRSNSDDEIMCMRGLLEDYITRIWIFCLIQLTHVIGHMLSSPSTLIIIEGMDKSLLFTNVRRQLDEPTPISNGKLLFCVNHISIIPREFRNKIINKEVIYINIHFYF